MRFFTDHFFTATQKSEMLGNTGRECANARLIKNQVETARQVRQREAAVESSRLQGRLQAFDRKAIYTDFVVMALAVLLVILINMFGG